MLSSSLAEVCTSVISSHINVFARRKEWNEDNALLIIHTPVFYSFPKHSYLEVIDVMAITDTALTLHHNGDGLVGAGIDGQVVHVLLSAHHPGKLCVHKHVASVVDVTQGEAGWVGLREGVGKREKCSVVKV